MKSLRGERLSSEYQKAVYEIISTTLKNRTDKIKGLVSVALRRTLHARGVYPPRACAYDAFAYRARDPFFVGRQL